MDEVRDATEALLEEKPELEDGLREVLEVDADRASWEFDDVPLDSGQFGEVVSRGLVEETDGGYRVVDRAAVTAAIDGGRAEDSGIPVSSPARWISDLSAGVRSYVRGIDRRVAALLALALALVVLFRLVPYGTVFRGDAVVLSGNDAYMYRYWVDFVVERAAGPADLGVLAEFPDGLATEEPLLVATLWWFAELFGGDRGAVGLVVALFPVATTVATGLLVYALAKRTAGDWRVGVAAVSFLAIMPLHAIRTGVGFADHHAFDYPWLVLTALALVLLVDRDVRSRRTWAVAGVLGLAVAAQTLAWDNGALLLIPVGAYAALRTISDLRAGKSPLSGGLPVAGGVGLGAVLVGLAHVGLGWQSGVVAAVPAVLFAAILGVLVLAELHAILGASPYRLLAAQGIGGLVAVLVAFVAFPSLAGALLVGLDRLFGTEGIAEATALLGGHFEWLFGPLVFFGFALLLALPAMAWAGWRTYREHDPAWLVATVYAWFFFVLTNLQIRFGGEFSLFAAVFAGFGFVKLAAWVEVLEPTTAVSEGGERSEATTPLESMGRRDAMYAAGLWLGVGSLGAILTPLKHGQVTTGSAIHGAAKRMRAYADRRGWEYPENYVFSNWDRNRAYNYFVNGESKSYTYARKWYPEFMSGTTGGEWYHRLAPRAGFVVTRDEDLADDAPVAKSSLYYQLHFEYGSPTSHYRAIWASADGSTKAFALVPGARVMGEADPGGSLTFQREVPAGETSFTFERTVRVNDHGVFDVRLPQPGEYSVGDRTVTVPESAVEGGEEVSLFSGPGVGYWSFDERHGTTAYDRVGGAHGSLVGDVGWTDEAIDGSALVVDGNGYAQLPLSTRPQFSISLWIRPEADLQSYQHLVYGQEGPLLVLKAWGAIRFRLPGVPTEHWTAGEVPAGTWTHVVATYDGAERTLYVDGEHAGSNTTGDGTLDWGDWLRVGGRSVDGSHGFDGAIDELRLFDSAIGPDRVEELYGGD